MMDAVFLRLLNMSITAGWLILVVVLLRVLLKKAPRYIRCVLWALVAVRLVCPVTLESSLSLVPSAETVPQAVIMESFPSFEVDTGVSAIDAPVNDYIGDRYFEGVTVPHDADGSVMIILGWVWLAGAAAMLLYALKSLLRLRHRVSEAAHLRDNIWECDGVSSPFILGVARPRIYLPSGMESGEAAHVIAHENAHLSRRDHWWKPLGFLLLAVYWFNPLIWLAYILLCRDIELACDERVVREMGIEDKKAYSEALLACSMPRRMVAACPLAFGEVGVKERIKTVLNYKKPAFWIILVAVIACVAVAVCFLTNPKGKWGEEPPDGSYRVSEILYQAPMYSFGYTLETAPQYTLTENSDLLERGGVNGDELLNLGELSEIPLSAGEYEALFPDCDGEGTVYGYDTAHTAKKLRRVWRSDTVMGGSVESPLNIVCFIFELKNGDLLLSYGYPDRTRWLFKLEKTAETVSMPAPSAFSPPAALVPGDAYVSSACLYMNPLSSFFGDGDSGCRYMITPDDFLLIIRATESTLNIPVSEWGWQDFPWTDEEWAALYMTGGIPNISEVYDKRLYQPLDDDYSLLSMDGQLWLVETRDLNRAGRQLWSIYLLVPEASMGSAEWKFMPALSSQYPAFRFEFDMPFDKVMAVCVDGGRLIGYDDHDGVQYPQGAELTVTPGSALYWAPMGEGGSIAMSGSIQFTVQSGGTTSHMGTIYVTGESAESGGKYTATIVGGGLHMEQATENYGAVISPA